MFSGVKPTKHHQPAEVYDWMGGALPSRGSGGAGEDAMPKVLLIEDHDETAQQIMDELSGHGYEVDRATTGIEGLDKARAGEADIMIVDRLLPGIDGLTIIEVA